MRQLDTPKDRKADVVVHLVVRQGTVKLADGDRVQGYTVNGTSPGPLIEATQGQLVEVHVHNQDVTDGIAIHWHGVDVPNAEDGVAGITQNAIKPGQDYTYRWVAKHAGTYWYHSHQVSHEQVAGGLLGGILIHPKVPDARGPRRDGHRAPLRRGDDQRAGRFLLRSRQPPDSECGFGWSTPTTARKQSGPARRTASLPTMVTTSTSRPRSPTRP